MNRSSRFPGAYGTTRRTVPVPFVQNDVVMHDHMETALAFVRTVGL